MKGIYAYRRVQYLGACETARIVFQSGLPIELIGWQLCRGSAVVSAEDIDELTKLGTSFADFAIRANSFAKGAYHRQTGEHGIPLPDPVAMGVLLDPSLCLEASQHYLEVETESALTRGMTVVDRLNVAGDPRNRHVWSEVLNEGTERWSAGNWMFPRWKALLFDALR